MAGRCSGGNAFTAIACSGKGSGWVAYSGAGAGVAAGGRTCTVFFAESSQLARKQVPANSTAQTFALPRIVCPSHRTLTKILRGAYDPVNGTRPANVDRNRTPGTSEFLTRHSVIHGVQLPGIPQAYTTVRAEIASLPRPPGGAV